MIKTIRSMKRGKVFWAEGPTLTFQNVDKETQGIVSVSSEVTHQTHMGFGGAFTESAATVINSVNEDMDTLIDAYFAEDGLKYNLGRTVIHSCDFSVASRSYIDEHDESLESFDMKDDDVIIVPFIKKAINKTGGLWLLASPWSPPAFMKDTNNLYYGGTLKEKYYPLWAKYMVRYLLDMEERGIKIEAISIQNEPEAVQVWESCEFTIDQEKKMVDVLYDAIKETNLDTKIVIWDHNRDRVAQRAHGVLKDLKDKVWGVGYHWYVTEDSENLSLVHHLYPNQHILFTEGCVEYSLPDLNNGDYEDDLWKHGEHYGRNIIKDSLHYSEGFIDWNLFLDEEGGPNHVGNFCEAPIMVDKTTKTIQYNPSYYYIGHFSRYIEVGAKRIDVHQSVDKETFVTAYKNPNGTKIIVIQNEGLIKEKTVVIDGQSFLISLPEHSITTVIID